VGETGDLEEAGEIVHVKIFLLRVVYKEQSTRLGSINNTSILGSS
jgi:hypothetical protein